MSYNLYKQKHLSKGILLKNTVILTVFLSRDLFFVDTDKCWSEKQHPGRQPLCV